MIVGAIRSQFNSIWDDVWSGGVSNPFSVIEQFTYLLSIRWLDELQQAEEAKAAGLKADAGDLERLRPEGGLWLFVRSLVGLDRDVAKEASPRLWRSSSSPRTRLNS